MGGDVNQALRRRSVRIAIWLTVLPGFPDGSYGWAQVDRMLGDGPGPRLYVEPVGQGDSDKPRHYPYSTIERADLVTVSPHQRCVTFWERVIMPQIWLLLGLRYHPRTVNRAWRGRGGSSRPGAARG